MLIWDLRSGPGQGSRRSPRCRRSPDHTAAGRGSGRSHSTRLRPWRKPSVQLKIMPLDRVVRSSFPTLTVTEAQAGYIRNGRRLAGVILPDRTTALLDQAGALPGAVSPGRTGCCCRGGVCLSYRFRFSYGWVQDRQTHLAASTLAACRLRQSPGSWRPRESQRHLAVEIHRHEGHRGPRSRPRRLHQVSRSNQTSVLRLISAGKGLTALSL